MPALARRHRLAPRWLHSGRLSALSGCLESRWIPARGGRVGRSAMARFSEKPDGFCWTTFLIEKLPLPGASQEEDDWGLFFFLLFLGSHSVKEVFMQSLKFSSYLPKRRWLADTLCYKPSVRWMLVFNIIPGKAEEVTDAGLFDPGQTHGAG